MTKTGYADFEKLCINMNEKLLIVLKELKAQYNMSWNSLFSHLAKTNERPENIIRNYKRIFEDPKKEKVSFQPWLAPKTIIDFGVWCAPFSNQTDALDFLVNLEKSKNTIYSSYKIVPS